MHKIIVNTSNYDSTILISIVSLYFTSKKRKNHGVKCVFNLLFILVYLFYYLFYIFSVFSSDNIIFINQMHEIDDVGANELNEIFET